MRTFIVRVCLFGDSKSVGDPSHADTNIVMDMFIYVTAESSFIVMGFLVGSPSRPIRSLRRFFGRHSEQVALPMD